MDPLSVTASILAVVGAAGKVLAGLQYVAELRKGPKIFKDLYAQIRTIEKNLITIQEPIKIAEAKDEPAMRNALSNLKDNVDQVQGILNRMNQLIDNVQGADKTEPKVSISKWTLHQSNFKTISDHLDKSQQNLQTSLSSAILSQLISRATAHPDSPSPRSPIWTVPYRQDRDFIDRPEILSRLEQLLVEPASRAALVGLGGVGKSQLAIEYSWRLQQRSPQTSVFWVYTGSIERFEAAYREIADKLNVRGRHQPDADIKKLVFDALSDGSCGEWLLVVDNADDPALFEKTHPNSNSLAYFIPQSRNGRVLVTSRNKNAATSIVGRHQDIIAVDEMSRNQAMSFLEKKLEGTFEEDNASELLEVLGHVPLALSHAAGYINEHKPHVTIPEYLRRFKENEGDLVSLLGGERTDDRRDQLASNAIATTLQISFRHVQEASPLAACVLRLMCYFDRQYIPTKLITKPFVYDLKTFYDLKIEDDKTHLKPTRSWRQKLRNVSTQIRKRNHTNTANESVPRIVDVPTDPSKSVLSEAFGETDVLDGLSILSAYSLISLTQDGLAYSMHRLVQLAGRNLTRSQLSVGTWHLQAAVSVCDFFLNALRAHDYPKIRTILSHTQVLLQDSTTVSGDEPVQDNTENRKHWIVRAIALCLLAQHHVYCERYEVAKSLILKSLTIFDSTCPPYHSEALVAKLILGWVVVEDDCSHARNIYLEILAIAEKCNVTWLERNRKWVYNSIGNCFGQQEDYTSAKTYYLMALDLSMQESSKSFNATLEQNITLCDIELGNLPEAETRIRKVVADLELSLPKDNYGLLSSKVRLVETLLKQGKYNHAEQLSRPTLESLEKTVGYNYPRTLDAAAYFADSLFGLCRYEDASKINQRCLTATEQYFGRHAEETLRGVWLQAKLFDAIGNYTDANLLYLRAAEGFEKLYGVENSDAARIRRNIEFLGLKKEARNLCEDKKYTEAKALYLQVAKGVEKLYRPDYPLAVKARENVEAVQEILEKLKAQSPQPGETEDSGSVSATEATTAGTAETRPNAESPP